MAKIENDVAPVHFLQDYLKSNDRATRTVEMMAESEKLAGKADQEHGQAAILRVATLARAIHGGDILFDEEYKDLSGKVFNKSLAVDMARALYSRTLLVNPMSTARTRENLLGDIYMERETVAQYLNAVAQFFHPYTYGKVVCERSMTKKAATTHLNGDKETAPPVELVTAMDKIDRARARTKNAFRLAVLYVYLDQDGAMLDRFDPKTGLLAKDQWLCPITSKGGVLTVWKADRVDGKVRIPAAAATAVNVLAKADLGEAGSGSKLFRSGLQSLASAWTVPTSNTSKDELLSALGGVAKLLTVAKVGKLTPDQTKLLTAARTAINAYDAAVTAAENLAKENEGKANVNVRPIRGGETGKGYAHTIKGEPVAVSA